MVGGDTPYTDIGAGGPTGNQGPPRDRVGEQTQTTVSRLLEALDDGDRDALDELFPLVYDQLRTLAHRQRRRWDGDTTLTTTALVHELYIKLAEQTRVSAESRAHLYALAGKAMRHILSNYSRQRRAQKRGGTAVTLPLEETKLLSDSDSAEAQAVLLATIDDALGRLEQVHPRRARVVECRFYGGMSIPDTAKALGISPRTVKRDWTVAQAWLHRELRGIA
jgi:RNA polymerase sigma factor (TIGR02999 family)